LTMGAELSEADVRKTTEIVRQLSDEAKSSVQGGGPSHGRSED